MLQAAELNPEVYEIRSPVDGVVILPAVEVGQRTPAFYSHPCFLIAEDVTKMQVWTMNVSEADDGIAEGRLRRSPWMPPSWEPFPQGRAAGA